MDQIPEPQYIQRSIKDKILRDTKVLENICIQRNRFRDIYLSIMYIFKTI